MIIPAEVWERVYPSLEFDIPFETLKFPGVAIKSNVTELGAGR